MNPPISILTWEYVGGASSSAASVWFIRRFARTTTALLLLGSSREKGGTGTPAKNCVDGVVAPLRTSKQFRDGGRGGIG